MYYGCSENVSFIITNVIHVTEYCHTRNIDLSKCLMNLLELLCILTERAASKLDL